MKYLDERIKPAAVRQLWWNCVLLVAEIPKFKKHYFVFDEMVSFTQHLPNWFPNLKAGKWTLYFWWVYSCVIPFHTTISRFLYCKIVVKWENRNIPKTYELVHTYEILVSNNPASQNQTLFKDWVAAIIWTLISLSWWRSPCDAV